MKIAVPSDDGINMAQHFGRAKYFIIYENAGGKITNKEVRGNAHSWNHPGQHNAECGDGSDDHEDLLAALGGCQVVICHGMGRIAMKVLEKGGIKSILTDDDLSPEQAVRAYLAGDLKSGNDPCGCNH